ncbi:hypothetical protein ACIQF6_28475 [Kitasatospora sp. NPDC092948]|uniref:hypothetical protein n=1 Tax=Kitasatospora sp. NPDC092948 TaxID=3364088 RepID=UPI0037FA81BB
MTDLLQRAIALAKAGSPSARTLIFDFDGVIHDESGGWRDGEVSGTPLDGAVDVLRAYLDGGWCIAICTARHSDYHEAAAKWLRGHVERPVVVLKGAETAYWQEPGTILMTNVKPGGVVFIDNNVRLFTGWDKNPLAGLPTSPDDLPLDEEAAAATSSACGTTCSLAAVSIQEEDADLGSPTGPAAVRPEGLPAPELPDLRAIALGALARPMNARHFTPENHAILQQLNGMTAALLYLADTVNQPAPQF